MLEQQVKPSNTGACTSKGRVSTHTKRVVHQKAFKPPPKLDPPPEARADLSAMSSDLHQDHSFLRPPKRKQPYNQHHDGVFLSNAKWIDVSTDLFELHSIQQVGPVKLRPTDQRGHCKYAVSRKLSRYQLDFLRERLTLWCLEIFRRNVGLNKVADFDFILRSMERHTQKPHEALMALLW